MTLQAKYMFLPKARICHVPVNTFMPTVLFETIQEKFLKEIEGIILVKVLGQQNSIQSIVNNVLERKISPPNSLALIGCLTGINGLIMSLSFTPGEYLSYDSKSDKVMINKTN